MKLFITVALILILFSCKTGENKQKLMPSSTSDLRFSKLAVTWDEAIPIGNGMLGALIWEKEKKLRLSLDRADLWDLRPMENLDRPEWKYSWVKEQWEKDNYSVVQNMFDAQYDRNPAPSKIPGGAMEFDISALGETESVELKLENALCVIKWKNGTTLETFVNAESPVGWFRFTGKGTAPEPEFLPPAYNVEAESETDDSHSGQDLRLLGYPAGELVNEINSTTFNQKGWGGFQYQVNVRWKKNGNATEGCWSISSDYPGQEKSTTASDATLSAMKTGYSQAIIDHSSWWKNFWSQSGISLPDSVLQKQWYLEMYKLGSATGNGAPPISLQAVWTADNGKLPPWKGDFHNDLNTQLSYWPSYSSNHLVQESGFISWLEKNKPEFEKYTRQYFDVSGLNVPGVATLTGQPMGGWIQYSFGPTVSAWLAHHFYLHWRYSMDREFLEKEAYPWIKEVAQYLEELSVTDSKGLRKLPLSSSPEIYNNSREAWFTEMTNFDLGLVRWTFDKAAELAAELGKAEESQHWKTILSQWPVFDIDPESGFTYVRGKPYNESHRHFSHLIAFHPLGLVDMSHGEADQKIISSTIATLDRIGPDWWCGYSYSWLGNIKARAFDGKGAAEALKIFSEDFCLRNSFHVNGDQSGTGKSKFTYRPFTLEGNFAFASGIQEMLIQSHTGVVRIFPAIPDEWKDAAFTTLRTEGAFLVSANMEKGEITLIDILSEKGGELKILNPFRNNDFNCSAPYTLNDNILAVHTQPGQKIRMKK
ncbi:MAG: glycoside hydrolase N-terminal domain-containing protein [Bacteroidales bacterium]|nr:glycoside hydrolase N-terminal domain-containing protein [Bacteroidales bacterium]